MYRRKYRMVKNPYGTSHPEATLRPGSAEGLFHNPQKLNNIF